MLSITTKSPYALSALVELHHRGDSGPVPIAELARRRDIPVQFLEQLFATLRRAGILRSQRGVKGGYTFARPPAEVTVLEIVELLDGPLGGGAEGVFSEDSRIELIRGEIVSMSPIGGPHVSSLIAWIRSLSRLIPRVDLSVQNPLRIHGLQSEPEPDLVVVWPRSDFASRPPETSDVILLIEVADSSLVYDRDVKVPLYAEAGIPETWLADLNSDTIFAYRQPSPDGYQKVREYRRGDWISPEAFPDERFLVDDLLG